MHPNKTNPSLGVEIKQHLSNLGIETPVNQFKIHIPKSKKIAQLTDLMEEFVETLGLDLKNDSIQGTPQRIAKMFVEELCYGLDYDHFPKCTTVKNSMDAGIVVEKDIKVMSVCEHHFVTIDGLATVAYIPKSVVLGLSKINRIVDFFARRPQIQERLTNQIWHTLNYILDTQDIAVYIDAVHYCVKSRGAEDQNSHTITNKLGGCFMTDSATRAEFMSLARKN